jgi:hypothetical protein
MLLCEVAEITVRWSLGYLAWSSVTVVGVLFMNPAKLSWQLESNRAGLRDGWQKIRAGTWQSPIFAAFLPVVWLFILPMTYPLAAFGVPVLLLVFGSLGSC